MVEAGGARGNRPNRRRPTAINGNTMIQGASRTEEETASGLSAGACSAGNGTAGHGAVKSSRQQMLRALVRLLAQQGPGDEHAGHPFGWLRYAYTRNLMKVLKLEKRQRMGLGDHLRQTLPQRADACSDGESRQERFLTAFLMGANAALHYRDPAVLRSRITLSRPERSRTDLEALRGDVLRALRALVHEGGDGGNGEEEAAQGFRSAVVSSGKVALRTHTA